MSMFGMFNRGPKAAPQEAMPKFQDEDPQMFEALREQIQKSAVAFEKAHLIENDLNGMTERVARALHTAGVEITEEVLSSDMFRETLAKALDAVPTSGPNYMMVDKEGGVLGVQNTKSEVVNRAQEEHDADTR